MRSEGGGSGGGHPGKEGGNGWRRLCGAEGAALLSASVKSSV